MDTTAMTDFSYLREEIAAMRVANLKHILPARYLRSSIPTNTETWVKELLWQWHISWMDRPITAPLESVVGVIFSVAHMEGNEYLERHPKDVLKELSKATE